MDISFLFSNNRAFAEFVSDRISGPLCALVSLGRRIISRKEMIKAGHEILLNTYSFHQTRHHPRTYVLGIAKWRRHLFFPDLTVLRANQSHDEINIRSYIVGTGLSRCDNLFIQIDCYRHDLHNQSLGIMGGDSRYHCF